MNDRPKLSAYDILIAPAEVVAEVPRDFAKLGPPGGDTVSLVALHPPSPTPEMIRRREAAEAAQLAREAESKRILSEQAAAVRRAGATSVVWVIDNGASYSDHEFIFVETLSPEEDAEMVDHRIEHSDWGEPFVVAVLAREGAVWGGLKPKSMAAYLKTYVRHA